MKNQIRITHILPSLLTTGALFCGFYSILLSIRGNYETAMICIVVAGIFDLFDGFVARALNAQSVFGAQYDSLSDAVSFGVAPAVLLHAWLQKIVHILPMPIIPYIVNVLPMFYLLCVVLRLARFNSAADFNNRFFLGAPSPAAAFAVCALVNLALDPVFFEREFLIIFNICLIFTLVAIGFLMVSRVPYPSFKGIKLSWRAKPFVIIVLLIFIVASVQEILWVLIPALLYVLGVALWYLVRMTSRRVTNKDSTPPSTPPSTSA